jgi:hypothetical protein
MLDKDELVEMVQCAKCMRVCDIEAFGWYQEDSITTISKCEVCGKESYYHLDATGKRNNMVDSVKVPNPGREFSSLKEYKNYIKEAS